MTHGHVLGLDLSLTSTGVARASQGRILGSYAIRTTGKKGDQLPARWKRLAEIRRQISAEIATFNPELVVIEAPSYGSTMGSQHDRSGLWWLTVDVLFHLADIPVATVSPNGRAKYGSGKGNAKKEVVHAAVKERYGRPDLPIKGNDEADAVILAAMGSRKLGHAIEVGLPLPNLEAMDGASWPTGLAVR